jgi:hypothetical protein
MQHLTYTTKHLFHQIEDALSNIANVQYTNPIALLGNSTIGQHVRHIIELYQEMLTGYRTGEINYEKRQRNLRIESDIQFAVEQMNHVYNAMHVTDKNMLLTTCYCQTNDESYTTTTNLVREMIYNIEHTIHHMAIIRIAFKATFNIELEDSFGVAPSTIKYRKQCAQSA